MPAFEDKEGRRGREVKECREKRLRGGGAKLGQSVRQSVEDFERKSERRGERGCRGRKGERPEKGERKRSLAQGSDSESNEFTS